MLLKTTRTALLTVYALDNLAESVEGCCPICCLACWALKDMSHTVDLEDILLKAPPANVENKVWWDKSAGSVRRTWLWEKWNYDCPNHPKGD